MGFDVLAFESGLYDCHRAWREFENGKQGRMAAQVGVFGIWTGSRQTASLWSYLQEQASSKNPLQLAGFDCQYTASASSKFLKDDLSEIIVDSKFKFELATKNRFLSAVSQLVRGETPEGDNQWFIDFAQDLRRHLASRKDREFDVKRSRFWQQQLKSMIAHTQYRWRDDPGGWSSTMARDIQMADNLSWLVTEEFPNRKIIVWAASFHIVRNIQQIEVPDGSVDYSELTQMGSQAHETLQSKLYTVGFTAYQGQAGIWFRNSWNIGTAPTGTFEDLCFQAGLENAFVPLTADWHKQERFMRPLGYSWMKSKWSENFDAIVFNRDMTPSTGN